MKRLMTTIALMLFAGLSANASPVAADPVVAFRSLVSAMPTQGQIASTQSSYVVTDIAFDVKKTESLVTPIIGIIDFTAKGVLPTKALPRGYHFSMRYRLEFAWINDQWVFNRVLHEGRDFTNSGGGNDILDADPMHPFLAPYRNSNL
jgi:hypothetical protein